MDILWRIIGMAANYPVRLSLAYITALIAIGFSLAIPWLFGTAIDLMVGQDPDTKAFFKQDFTLQALVIFGLGILAVSVGRGLCDFGRTYTTESLSQKVSFDCRNLLYDKLQNVSFAFHDKEHTGDLMSRATADVEAMRRFVNMGMIRSLDVVIRILAIPIILFVVHWQLALVSMIFVPAIILRSSFVMRALRRKWLHVQEVMGQSVTVLQENLAGMHVVKAFASEDYERAKYNRKAEELRVEYYDAERMQGTNSAWMTLYFTFALGIILWIGGWLVVRGELTLGQLAMFFLYLNQLTFPVRMSAQIINTFSRAISSGQRLFRVLDTVSPVSERPNASDMGRATGHVKFENVAFSYEDRSPALRQVDLDAKPGHVTAILGAPGSGKTTVVSLLPRFYDVTSGQITIDGHDIRDFTLQSLRHNVGIVHQDVYLFSASIRDNISYGVVGATQEDVERAAKVAQLHDQIMSLPGGYDTWVGERGTTLSGGQRQRLSIARTILIDPPVLILDDSTSSVDVETERQIHRAMTEVMKGRTTFVIAHRLSTVREADQILVLDKGVIAERGSHAELLRKNGIYQSIYELQLRPQEEVLLEAAVPAYGRAAL
ncbi:MAG: ABC transporter ATP-binding protein [Chloroflexi bacterium]|nr:ABC transporter ATP-binding protein [Chloroflexota bacterium]